MKHDYKIVVHMQPHPHDNPENPYFWCIMQYVFNAGWCNSSSGWAITPEQAFNDAQRCLNMAISDVGGVGQSE